MKRSKIIRFLRAAFFIRLLFCLIKTPWQLLEPHVWRQTDTLAVSFRYFQRFSQEPLGLVSFLPAVLQSSDGNGVLPMEFPLLNLTAAPCWAFGLYWGKTIICLLFVIFTFWACWKLSKSKVWFAPAFLLIPYVSYSADYIDKFIPDSISNLLVLLGVMLLIKDKKSSGQILVALGLLVKPTAIVAICALFLLSKFRHKILYFVKQLIPPVIICCAYYTLGVRIIDHFRSGDVLIFAIEARNPFLSVVEVFSNPAFLFQQFRDRLFMAYGGIFVVLGLVIKKKRQMYLGGLGCFLILLIQFTTIAALDGKHSAQHDYYYMGLSAVAASLIYFVLRQGQIFYSNLMAFIFLAHACELSLQNFKREKIIGFYNSRAECRELKMKHPDLPWSQNYVFRTHDEPFPAIGLCFGEREGSKKSLYGIYLKNEVIPEKCAIIDQSKTYTLTRCQ